MALFRDKDSIGDWLDYNSGSIATFPHTATTSGMYTYMGIDCSDIVIEPGQQLHVTRVVYNGTVYTDTPMPVDSVVDIAFDSSLATAPLVAGVTTTMTGDIAYDPPLVITAGAASAWFDVSSDGREVNDLVFNLTQFDIYATLYVPVFGWVPINESSFAASYTPELAPGVSFVDSVLTANNLNIFPYSGSSPVAKLEFRDQDLFEPPVPPASVRITVLSYHATSLGDGEPYYPATLLTTGSGDSTIDYQDNQAAPEPADFWTAADVVEFLPTQREFGTDGYNTHFDYLPTGHGTGSGVMPTESWQFLVEVWDELPPTAAEFWTRLVLATTI